MLRSQKEKKDTYSQLITEKIKEYLKDYLKNIDFDMSYNNSHFVFEVKDVEVRSDILKKFGIPLELTKGKIQEIKVTIQSITFNKPILIEVQGVNIEMRTIYLSRDYKKDYKSFRQKILDEWEKNHKEFLQNLMKTDSIFERMMVDQMIPMKIEINNVKCVILDTVTSQVPCKIALVIGNITSYGCDQSWEPIHQHKDEMGEVRRIFNVSKSYVNIFHENYIRHDDSDGILRDNLFIQPLDFHVKLQFPLIKNPDLRRTPKIHIEVSLESPLFFDVSFSKLKFLSSFLNYLLKIKKVEKYWIHRPEIKDEVVTPTMAKEWFKYAFRVVREEVRNKKRQTNDFSTLIEKIVNMERYIQFYKTSHKLIIAPWIIYNDCSEDLGGLENKMSLEDIIYCREIAFTELITEGRAFCASGKIGEGYKPLIHLWEFYVNDLRSKWMNNKTDSNARIELSPDERRDLMLLANLDKDKVFLSYLKGEPNHPEDIISSFKINLDIIIINISRKVKSTYVRLDKKIPRPELQSEIHEQMKLYKGIYSTILKKALQKTKFYEYLDCLTEEDLRGIILEEGKAVQDMDDSSRENEEDSSSQNNIDNTFNNRELETIKLNLNDDKTHITGNKNVIQSNREREHFNTNQNLNLYQEKDKISKKNNSIFKMCSNNNNMNMNDSDSIGYLDEIEDLNDIIIEDNRESYPIVNNQLKDRDLNQVSFQQSSKIHPSLLRKESFNPSQKKGNSLYNNNNNKANEIPYTNINNLLKGEATQFENINKVTETIKRSETYKTRKTILSIVFGQSYINRTLLRNDAEDSNVKVHSFNLIDHNLTYTVMNKYNEVYENHDLNKFFSKETNKDYIRLLFTQIFNENEYGAFSYLDDKVIDPAESQTIYFEAIFAKFLADILIIQKNRDSVLMNDFVEERNFINDYIYKFGLKQIDGKTESTQIEEVYQKYLIYFLLQKDVFKEKLQIIEKTIKQTKLNYLLHEKFNIFNRKFIAKVFEKGCSKSAYESKNKLKSNMNNEEILLNDNNNNSNKSVINIIKSNFHPISKSVAKKSKKETKSNINLIDEEKIKDEKIRADMIHDLNFVMQEISVNLMKYIFSSMYPYFMNEKGIQLVYKKNLKVYSDKISERIRDKNKKILSNTMRTAPDSEYFIVLTRTKEGREYPHYIYKENDSMENINTNNKDNISINKDKKIVNEIELENLNINNNNIKNMTKTNKFEPTNQNKHENVKQVGGIKQISTSSENKTTLTIKMLKEININISNETLAELICIIPHLKSDTNETISFAGNILTDLKKSYLEIYENLRQIKAKWKVMEYLKDLKEKKGKPGNILQSDSFEMNYLLSKLRNIEDLLKTNTSIDLNIFNFNIKIIDKLYFITYEKFSSLTLNLKGLQINNRRMTKLPILNNEKANEVFYINNLNKDRHSFSLNNKDLLISYPNIVNINATHTNKVKNLKNFDFDLILKNFIETTIYISNIYILVDDEYPLLHTNLNAKLMSSMITNVPFLPDLIIDINSSFIKVNISPSIIKVSYIFSNMNYYTELYKNKFEIMSHIQNIGLNKNNKETHTNNNNNESDNKSSIIAHFHKKLQINLLKILENKNNNKELISYLKNRTSTIVFYSIGKSSGSSDGSVNTNHGIFIKLRESDSFFNNKSECEIFPLGKNGMIVTESAQDGQDFHENVHDNNSNMSENKSSRGNIEDSIIFTLHIPILIFNLRDTLFYKEKQLWLSDVFTYKINENPNLNFEKIKIKFDSDEQFKFTSFEFLFCKLFINTTDFLLHNNYDIQSLKDAEFKSKDFPFDLKFETPSKLKLNNLYTQKSFYYEEEETLRNKIYSKLFINKSEPNRFNNKMSTGEIMSYLKINIEKISCQIFAKINSQIFSFYNNMKDFADLDKDLKQNKFNFLHYNYVVDLAKRDPNTNNKDQKIVQIKNNSITKATKKLSMHRILIHIKDIKLKAFYNTTNSHSNLMLFFVMNNITYQENMNILMHNFYKDDNFKNEILIQNEQLENVPITLSNLFISNLKLVLSIPSNFRSEDRVAERIQVLDKDKMNKVYSEMKKEVNKLIVLLLGNISMKLIQRERSEIELKCGDAIKLGFVKREGEKVRPEDIEHWHIEPIVFVTSSSCSKTVIMEDDNNKDLDIDRDIDNSYKDIDIDNNEIKLEQNKYTINNDSNTDLDYSIKFSINSIAKQKEKRNSICFSPDDKSSSFYNLFKTITILKSLVTLQSEYMLNINVNDVKVEIPWYLYHYVYYLRNHLRHIGEILKERGKDNEGCDDIEIKNEPLNMFTTNNNTNQTENNNNSIINLEIIKNTNPSNTNLISNNNIIVTDQSLFPKEREDTQSNKINIIREKKLKELQYHNLVKRFSSINFGARTQHEPSSPNKDKTLKDKNYNLLKWSIPNFNLTLKQKTDSNIDVIFLDTTIFKTKGDVSINFQDRSKDILSIKIDDIKWKPYECRYPNLIVKHTSNKYDLFELEIKINMPVLNPIDEIRNKLLLPKEHPDDLVQITAHLKGATFVMINKCISELTNFFEHNTECLKENPLKEQMKLLETIEKVESTIFKLRMSDGVVMVPESSQSANLIGLNFKQGCLCVKKSNELPKILVELKDKKMLIIDKKTCFNMKSITAEPSELVPHTRIEIIGEDISSYILIDNEIDSFFEAGSLNLTVRQPNNGSIVMLIRKHLWEEKFKNHVVCYKPSLLIEMSKAEINSSMGKLLSLKIIGDGNLDEKSTVIKDINAKFKNIDINFNIESGKGRVDLFKMHDDFTDNIAHITNVLPGFNNDLNIDLFNKNIEDAQNEK